MNLPLINTLLFLPSIYFLYCEIRDKNAVMTMIMTIAVIGNGLGTLDFFNLIGVK